MPREVKGGRGGETRERSHGQSFATGLGWRTAWCPKETEPPDRYCLRERFQLPKTKKPTGNGKECPRSFRAIRVELVSDGIRRL